MDFLIIQAIGLLGSILALAVMQVNNRKVVLITQFICSFLWITHYFLLGAYTAVIINLISIARAIIFYFNDKKWANNKIWLWVIIVLFALSPIIQWEAYYSVFPAIAMILTSIGLWIHNMKTTRLLFVINSPLMLAYNILCGSYSCAVTETFALASFILAVYRFDIKKAHTEDI